MRAMERFFAKLVVILHFVYSCAASCADKLYTCPDDQICIVETGECKCLGGKVLSGGVCVTPDPGGHRAVVVTVVLIAVALIAAGLILLVRNYNLLDCVRRRWQARNRDVLYDDVVLGQDDPPLQL